MSATHGILYFYGSIKRLVYTAPKLFILFISLKVLTFEKKYVKLSLRKAKVKLKS